MNRRIYWVSQNPILDVQREELRQLFGADVYVEHDTDTFVNAEEIYDRYQAGRYDEIVVVAPLSVIAVLTDLGLRPLWADMEQVGPRDTADLSFRGRRYKFKR